MDTTTGKRKLSELIREGAKLHPQCKGVYFQISDGKCFGSCAYGAALEAYTGAVIYGEYSLNLDMLEMACGVARDTVVLHPILNQQKKMYAVVTALNDEHDWTREQIADWLEAQGY